MSDFLQQMAVRSAERASGLKRSFVAADLDQPVYALELRGFDVIAELKDRSPAVGELKSSDGSRSDGRRSFRALQYVSGGAAAISVLTEPSRFAGSMTHLRQAVAAVSSQPVPVMRKDFLVDPLQILEARAAGASGVLLIAAMLADAELLSMLDCACEQSMFVLLESFDEEDLRRCAKLLQSEQHLRQAKYHKLLFGINSRNLRTLAVEPGRLQELAPLLPDGVVSVAESGLQSTNDIVAAVSSGYAMALIGTALMRSDEPDRLLRDLLSAGRQQVAA